MNFPATKIKNLLSNKKTTYAILLVAMLSRLIQLVYFFNIRVDMSYQLMAMQNFIDGHGISAAKVLPSDLSTTLYEPLINWPLGYSLLLAPFYLLLGRNYIAAGLALSILAGMALIFVTRAILKTLEIPLYLINLFTLLTSFFVYYFYFITSSDAVTITFFAAAIYYALLVIKSDKKSRKNVILFNACLFICAYLKYLFIPVVFILPAFLIIIGLIERRAEIKKTGVVSFLFLFVSVGLLLWYQKSISGSGVYISSQGRGFFPENLQSAYPFIPASFIKPDTLGLLLPKGFASTICSYQWVHFLVLLCFLAYIIRNWYKTGWKQESLTTKYFYIAFLLSLTISLLLMALSLRVEKEQYFPGILWTYVEEPRYYGLPNILIHVGVFAFYQFYKAKRSQILKLSFGILILLLLPEMLRGVVFNMNRILLLGKEEYSWQYEDRFQKYAADVIRKEQTRQPSEKTVITGTSYYMNHRVSLYCHAPILSDVQAINNLTYVNTQKPVLLLVILHKKDLTNFPSFLSFHKEAAGSFDGFNFYTIHISPH
jgi:hypothetical protein